MTQLAIGICCFSAGVLIAYRYLPDLLDFVIEKSQKRGFFNGPWKTHFGVGRKHLSAIERAAIARVGLGGNSSDETVYWNAFTDSSGQTLKAVFSYKIIIHSPLPVDYPGKGFWSITAYGEDKFLMNNDLKKYMIRHTDFDDAEYPITVILSPINNKNSRHHIPLSGKNEKFSLALRCYRPMDSMKNEKGAGSIQMPTITKL